jgi:Ni,Fe-hydrogenase I small subunit
MSLKLDVERVYHPYNLWEDYKAGFYDNISSKEKDFKIKKVLEMFNDYKKTEEYMRKVICLWKYSCEHNLTNSSMNKIAYLGQAACCIYAGVPCDLTMRGWKLLSQEVRDRSDKIANKIIIEWMLERRLNNTLKNGKKEGMKTEYQMKLHLF